MPLRSTPDTVPWDSSIDIIWLRDIQVLKTYGAAPYGTAIKKLEQQIKEKQTSVDEKIGVKVTQPRHTTPFLAHSAVPSS